MIYTEKTKEALKFAFDKHKNQLDKSGLPYIFHPFHLAEQMDDEDSTIVALLHDIIEDTDTSIEDIKRLGVSDSVIESLLLLTHNKDIDYFDYVKNLSNNSLAKKVKLADLKHNSDITRLNKVTDKDIERIEKYKKAIEILQNNDED